MSHLTSTLVVSIKYMLNARGNGITYPMIMGTFLKTPFCMSLVGKSVITLLSTIGWIGWKEW